MLANIGSAADGSSGSERVIVRFDSAASVNPTLLTREGAAILQYLSNHAYLVRLQGAEAKAIAGLPGVMEVRPQPDGHRIAASLVAAAKRGATLQRLTVLGARGQSPEAFRDTLGRILPADTQVSGARLLAGQPMVEVQASAGEAAATLAALADSESVIWIEGAPSVEAYNSDSVGPLQANRESGGAIPVVTPIWDQGLFGTGQIVTVMDGGLDRNEDFFLRLDRGDGPVEAITDATTVAPDDPPGPVFPERKVYGYWVDPASSPYDSLGDCVDPPTAPNVNGTFHGTHVTGTVLGDALTPSSPTASGYDPDDGMAPNAQVLFIDVGNDETRCVTEARNFTARAAQMTAVGSYLFNGSFGGRNPQAYSAYAAEADDAAYEFEDVLFVFAAGNRGEPESIGHPAVAKSVLAVGGTYPGLDERPYWNTSIGPALDGRIKPDIVAPGVRVRSANGNDRDDNPLPPFGNNPTTAEKSGTSMAAPQVTGGAALARQYFAEGFYPTGARNPADARVPSGALLKALLVNGAHPIGDLPNMTAGFGRVWLDNALFFEGDDRDLRLWDMRNAAGLETGESIEFPIRIEAGQELRATLAWYDPPGSPMAARALVNDLDLELVGNGATWRGNSHTRGESTTDGEPDRLNTVEQIRLSSPEAGDYLLRVRAHGVPGDGRPETRRQGFSLVVNAAQCASGVTAPPAFELAASEEEIDLSIQPLANAERFEVYRASGTCEASSGRGRLLGTTTSAFSDSKVVAGGEYAYTVRGVDGCGEGPVSVCKSIVAKGPPESDVSGPWFNATQSGHGWLVEQLDGIAPGDPDRINAYWYVYRDGAPVWLIGGGDLVDGQAELDVLITGGAEFPPDFDAADVGAEAWGTLSLTLGADGNGEASWAPVVDGFTAGTLSIEQLSPIPAGEAGCRSGSYYDPSESGHGFVIEVFEGDPAPGALVAWYVYLDGEQVWLLGQGNLIQDELVVDLVQYAGADFPPGFQSEDVAADPWGTLTFGFTGPDSATVNWITDVEGYSTGTMDVTRLTTLKGRSCGS